MRVVVVGGGPGGMEAARRLDTLGHKVTLIERSARLGGLDHNRLVWLNNFRIGL